MKNWIGSLLGFFVLQCPLLLHWNTHFGMPFSYLEVPTCADDSVGPLVYAFLDHDKKSLSGNPHMLLKNRSVSSTNIAAASFMVARVIGERYSAQCSSSL